MKFTAILGAALMVSQATYAQSSDDKDLMTSDTFKGMALRNIGPSFMSGRIADIEIDQTDPATWYVGVASGGVWKTENAGTTWTPLFDGESVYSIGTVTIDPSNKNVIWVGTGENDGGRHISFGDGVYRSPDGGKTWTNMGLSKSEHISEIIVHPEDPNTIWVASQGPLWSSGGERGVFKSTDGGKTWENKLSADEWTGVTDMIIDPRNPDRLYAATWQRQRTVAAYVGAGPESGLHMSDDGGETWTKLTTGLPKGNLGKTGMAISPQNPDVLYAAIELDQRTGGVWRSSDRGASWTKMSDMISGGTGPHYYQELFANPHKFDQIYLANNRTQVSDDGGATWRVLKQEYKHVDDHAIAFHPTDPDYIMVGSDGGIYESHDGEASWRYISNLPITQFYKVAVDDAAPFYYIYGGTQDNSTQGAPSRTNNRHGIQNSDWFITLFADGHQPATEPGNPDIIYSHWQQGNLVRADRTNGEVVHIQPQPKPGEPAERFNWDAPIYVSRHDPKRIYHASQRLWRSDDRGDSWTAISPDLTRNQDRMKLPVMGRQWSWEAGWDLLAMSNYNSITSVGESPLDENILYVGTDDGLVQITADGGATWRKVEVGDMPGVPDTAFVNDIRADLFDADTVYVALDNHKYGDYKPYLLKSTNRGRTWKSMTSDLPEKHLVWRIVQDHVDRNLFFLATEFGVFFTPDAGEKWIELTGGSPTISYRDVVIQRRENDLVAGSFGRGIFILDDYSALRNMDEDTLNNEALLFGGRTAWWYVERHPLGFSEGASQGHNLYRAPNPPFGANFTYYLKDDLKTARQERQDREKPLIKDGKDTPFPGFDVVESERRETAPEVWLTVRDTDGNVVRRIEGSTKKGFHRAAWDLRYPSQQAVSGGNEPQGFLAAPGTYSVTLSKRVRGVTTVMAGPDNFEVKPLSSGALKGADPADAVAFWERTSKLQRSVSAAISSLRGLDTRLGNLKTAITRSRTAPSSLDDEWQAIRTEVYAIDEALSGNRTQNAGFGATPQTIQSRLGKVLTGTGSSTYGPTKTHRDVLGYAEADFEAVRTRLNTLLGTTLPAFEARLIEAGAPWVAGAAIPAT
ncbi:VPS10 domain-containing protein [Kordiimonas aquimaris]|uniref:VPS10 domain-containing protein n=1 Tax=Kordiimonas aquimaris TaxID=707591 RepID=UPI0021D35298|nr:glycosyl hydrolase [Kordiimonas aquimaris]